MNRTLFSFFLVCSIGVILACNRPSDNEMPISIELSLEDSIQVNYEGLLDLMDIDPTRKRILLHDPQRGIILLTDFSGTHLETMEKRGDNRDNYGMFPWTPAQFMENGHFFLLGFKGYQEFGPDGRLIRSTPVSAKDIPSFSGRAAADNPVAKIGEDYLFRGITPRGEYTKAEPEYYENFQLLATLNPDSGKLHRFLHLANESHFRNGQAYDAPEMMPSFALRGDSLYVTVGTDPNLYLYHLDDTSAPIAVHEMEHTLFFPGQGKAPAEADVKGIAVDASAGRTRSLTLVDTLLLACYHPGFDPLDRERYQNLEGNYGEFMAEMEGKYTDRLLIMNLEGKRLADLEIPNQLDYRQLLYRNGELWFLSRFNKEQEEDFVKLYKVHIGTKN
ncbi:MAG: hypothetical protein JJU34_16980 [Lunatimonas sp.]|uniref:hypothetical protein n=1 Tax=Lunatimonas sp. TaxID=2060141 RepID=UPI00263B17B0|nr:hypothetical protein [Lunatimonas sp.]MCC5938975.1 hypothetical protein [Lunatimonas sp.]